MHYNNKIIHTSISVHPFVSTSYTHAHTHIHTHTHTYSCTHTLT